MTKIWEARQEGDGDMLQANLRLTGKQSYFSQSYLYKNKVANTLTSHEDSLVLFDAPKYTSKQEACSIGSYPQDYDFCGQKPHYMIGMSVPPVMTAQIAKEVFEQWLSKL
jgi:DNA (cytosine-5)-methyltransferase 1